ncbi:C40 family peptidase [Nonomuraea dietziae]|uniref:C40 family peptidase n=2 Tax=Nonomuraea dietziae TaxID=65515 RepID=UPI003318CEEF
MRGGESMHTVKKRLLVACCLLVATCPPAAAEPAPSAGEVAEARAAVRHRAEALGAASVRLANAHTRLEALVAEAGRKVEAYNGQLVRLEQAKARHAAATVRLKAAEAKVAEASAAVSMLAAQSYGGMDLSNPMVGMLSDEGGVPGYLHRAGMLASMGDEQGETLKLVRDTQEVAAVLRAQTQEAYAEQQDAFRQAQEAKAAARAAVDRQAREAKLIEAEKRRLQSRVDAARSAAERLARQREEALERARLEREARLATRLAHRGGAAAGGWDAGGSSATMGDVAADWALSQLGKPYVWAAAGPSSYDCSGLTMRAWEQVGVRLDHWTGTQWTSGPHIPLDQLRRGDLLFFGKLTSNPGDIHHVGMYIGRGLMVHAPQTGDVVRVASMWRRDLVGATRPR